MILCVFDSSFSTTILVSCVTTVSYQNQKFGERDLSRGHFAFPSGLATYMRRTIRKVREGERKGGWKASPH